MAKVVRFRTNIAGYFKHKACTYISSRGSLRNSIVELFTVLDRALIYGEVSEQDMGIVYAPCKYKYVLKCIKCGSVFKRMKRSNFVEHPECYICDCGGEISRIK